MSKKQQRTSLARRKLSRHKSALKSLNLPKKPGPNWGNQMEKLLETAKNRRPIETQKGIILTGTYAFTKLVIDEKKLTRVCKETQRRGFSKTQTVSVMKRNPFQLCMNYLCHKGSRKVDPKLQHKWARLLHYAYLHHVKAEDLLGFLYQEGSYERINKRYKKLIAARSD